MNDTLIIFIIGVLGFLALWAASGLSSYLRRRRLRIWARNQQRRDK